MATVMFGAARHGGAGEAVSVTKASQMLFAVGGNLPAGPAAALAAGRGMRLVVPRSEPTPHDDQAAEVRANPSGRRSPGCPANSPRKD
ncbi:hypothetical protein ACFC4G_02405 [Streptomyces sp. NPDC056002]|uniref:hypothetical protein n=1 Tax=Streptomyces sp. NPDC056002 TaxID=3345675 RepID=UPI0035DA53BB